MYRDKFEFTWPKYKTKEQIIEEQKEYIENGPFYNKGQALEILEKNPDVDFYFLSLGEAKDRLGIGRSIWDDYHEEGWLVEMDKVNEVISKPYSMLLAYVGS